MDSTWWRTPDQLDADQKQFALLPPEGNHLLTGPPGCGKTNLLLLRAKYLHGKGFKNILVLSYTNALVDFLRSGIDESKHFRRSLVQTYDSWLRQHLVDYYPSGLTDFDAAVNSKAVKKEDRQKVRRKLAAALRQANAKTNTKELYQAIFIDEAQDISSEEIELVCNICPRVMISGDSKQSLHDRDGLAAKGFIHHKLNYHYRIGEKICAIADSLLRPLEDNDALRYRMNYREDLLASDAALVECATVEEQYRRTPARVRDQVRAYPSDEIGILVPRKDAIGELKAIALELSLFDQIAFHGDPGEGNTFCSGKHLHVMTLPSSKGAEFRAVHIVNCEELKFPMHRRELIYTAVTRAKTSLTLYHTGNVNAPIEAAFAEPKDQTLSDIL